MWRRMGIVWSYLCFLSLMALLSWTIWQWRDGLLRIEFGIYPELIALSVLNMGLAIYIAAQRKKQFTVGAVIGIPELSSPNQPRVLVTEGIYSKVRNPRYLETLLWISGLAFFANYLAVYLALLAGLPLLHLIILLEERELYHTFGEEYLVYCKRVPRYLPRHFP